MRTRSNRVFAAVVKRCLYICSFAVLKRRFRYCSIVPIFLHRIYFTESKKMSDAAQASAPASAPASPKKGKSAAAKKPKTASTKGPKTAKPKAPANHPQYLDMVMKAIQVRKIC